MALNGTLLNTPGVLGVWNVSMYPCTQFRNETVKMFFDLWPEVLNGTFTYCCEDGASNLSLVNFTYGPHQGLLDPRPYFDLGVVETFMPYWRNWGFWNVPRKSIYFPLHCDYSDLHRLYVWRFWRKTMVRGAKTGAVLVGIVQAAVLVLVFFMWVWPFGRKLYVWRWKIMLKDWFFPQESEDLFSEWADLFTDWAHLILLALIGSCMMEAIGHSSLHTWRASVLYNAGAVYSYLTAMAIVSLCLRQWAVCILPRESVNRLDRKSSEAQHASTVVPSHRLWEVLRKIKDDWRWQKVFGQTAVLVLMGTYLVLVDTDDGLSMDTVAGIVLATVVAACIWSAGVTAVVALRSMLFLLLASSERTRLLDDYTQEDLPAGAIELPQFIQTTVTPAAK